MCMYIAYFWMVWLFLFRGDATRPAACRPPSVDLVSTDGGWFYTYAVGLPAPLPFVAGSPSSSQILITVHIFQLMNCTLCNHKADEPSHTTCRSHALCSIDGRYDRRECPACETLWERIRGPDPADAVAAMALLRSWVNGFSRNSKQSKCIYACSLFLSCILNTWNNFIWHKNLFSAFPTLLRGIHTPKYF